MRTSKQGRLLFVSMHDHMDVRAWSGTIHQMARMLEDQNFQVEYMPNLMRDRRFLLKAMEHSTAFVMRRKPKPVDRRITVAEQIARQIEQRLEQNAVDAVFSPSSIPIARLRTAKKKIFHTDATFAGIIHQYPELSHFSAEFIAEGHQLEKDALANCDLAIYSSNWAANSAIQQYGADPQKVHVVPFGSNLGRQPSFEEVLRSIKARDQHRCELLFMGVHWVRKGGSIALGTAQRLKEKGMDVRLTIMGCKPPMEEVPPYVRVMPFLDKRKPEDLKQLMDVIMNSHFLILPSMADCTPIVVNECNSLGVPALTSDVGGLPEMIREGVNGHLFNATADGAAYADQIVRYMNDRKAYEDLAVNAWGEHEEWLGWKASGHRMRELILSSIGIGNAVGQQTR